MYLTHLLHRATQQRPDQPFTGYEGRVRTTVQVRDRVARLAGALGGLGVRPGDRVAIVGLNSDRYLEVLFACWWVGAVPAPVNPRWAAPEVRRAVADVGAELIFADPAFLPLLSGAGTVVVLGDGPALDGARTHEDLIAAGPATPDTGTGGDALAVLIFSGGTTGTPKAVMHSHQGLMVSMLGSMGFARSCEPDGAALVMAPLFHIAALLGMLAQVLVGGTVVFADRFDAGTVLGLIERHRISTITAIPAMLQELIDHPDFAGTDTGSLRTVVYGAAPMPTAILERVLAALPAVQFVQGYGMTETAVIASLLGADHVAGGERLRSAGRASLHVEIRVVDADDREVPRGTVGELVTRGDHVMLGYWNRPRETADALRGGWLHTGDLAYMDAGGYLFIVDRAKDVIITGGENVYSVEVEDVVARHPAVVRCAVIGVPDDRWGERVHAVVQLAPGARLSVEELRAHVGTLIARFKAPRTMTVVDAIATTPTGKIDKRALRRDHH